MVSDKGYSAEIYISVSYEVFPVYKSLTALSKMEISV